MSRLFAAAVALLCLVAPGFAQTPAAPSADAPEKLLSPTTQLYLRWDGIPAHRDAYKNSYWGDVMAGPTGTSIRTLISDWPKLIGNSALTEPYREGKPLQEMKSKLVDFKNASKVLDTFADLGAIVAIEVRQPKLTLEGAGQALSGLLGGTPNPDSLYPDVQAFVIVPDAGKTSEVFFSTMRLIAQKKEEIQPLAIAGRKCYRMVDSGSDDPRSIKMAWWLEGKHFVLYFGTVPLEATVNGVIGNAKKGGITQHPLFVNCKKDPGYESVARGFVDTGRLITLAKGLAGPFVPGLNQRIDDLGIGNLQSIVFNSGFSGKESRGSYEFNLSGERKGLAKIVKQEPLGLKDLPPLPPDVTRFSALRIDPEAIYDTTIVAVETALLNTPLTPEEEDVKGTTEKIRLRREFLMKEIDKLTGMSIKKDLISNLGDKLVIYDSPSEGFSALGTVICISVKDPAKVKVAMDRWQRGLESLFEIPVKIRKRLLSGVEVRELYSPAFYVVTPTYSIVGEWLVFSIHPQPVHGFVLRAKGEIPRWKPDNATSARIAKLPKDACGLQFCDPRSTVQNLCCIGPIGLNILSALIQVSNSGREENYEPIEIGLLPNAHELNRHLFPNLTATINDGKSIRIEVNESFSLPLEFLGLETIVVGGGLLGYGGLVGALK